MMYTTQSRNPRGLGRLALSVSAQALGAGLLMVAGQGVAHAQAVPAVQDQTADDEAKDGDIVVTGFRASLESATNTKRRAAQIVESVTAEDIGKLPDASIAESIARLPGLTSQRLNGRSNVISIRGLGPDLSTTLLNGREQTSTGDSRAVEFDQYPSEIVSQVVVYKSPTASLIGQGLAGTTDIRTIRPLAAGKRILAFGARGVYTDLGALNAGSKDKGYRVNGTYVDQFANDTIGVALSASYVDEPYQVQEFNAWGYGGAGTAADPALLGGNRSFVTSTELKRLGVTGTVQYQPRKELTFTVDGFYSNFRDNQIRRGIELPLGFGGGFNVRPFNPATATVSNNQYVTGTFQNVRGVVRNDPSERNADLYSFGFNAKWDGDDGWHAFLDFGYSRTDRNELIFESYSGTGFNGDDGTATQPLGTSLADTIGFTSSRRGTFYTHLLNYSDPNLIRLTDPLGWSGGPIPQAGYYNNRVVNDELKQYRGQVEKDLENGPISSVQVGLNYTDRFKSLDPQEFFIRLPAGQTFVSVPTQFLQRPTDLSYLGLGPIISYDPRQLLAAGILRLQPNTAQDVLSKAYSVSERLLQSYLQFNVKQELGQSTLSGNFGVQAVVTNQRSNGNFFVGGAPQPIRLGTDYVDILPSLNLSLELPHNWIIRLAAAREIQRPRIDDTRVSIGYGYNQTLQRIEGGGGNPFLQPYRANAVDLNIEKYFAGGGVISLQGFYKDLQSFIFQGQFLFDFAAFPAPTNFPAGASTLGVLNVPVNTGGGRIYGGEISTNVPLGSLVKALDGFGLSGGGGITISSVTNERGQRQSIPGFSKFTGSGTLYYEKHGFSVRGSVRYRSSFLGELSVFGGSRGNRQAVPEAIVDGQIGYDFGKIGPLAGLSFYFQAQNLTDSPFSTVTNLRTPLQVIDYQAYGRRFYFGAQVKF
ncbi:MAG: TonB-dependent receptor [Sphingomonas sp.]